MAPKWLGKASLIGFLIGGSVLVLGPMLLSQFAPAEPPAPPPQEIQDDREALTAYQWGQLIERFGPVVWLFPVAGALLFMSFTGLIFAWVSRPLGNDLEKDPPADDG